MLLGFFTIFIFLCILYFFFILRYPLHAYLDITMYVNCDSDCYSLDSTLYYQEYVDALLKNDIDQITTASAI